MIQYILECIAFQLVFLVIYDLFLKRETFFQWNRFYLIATYILSLLLPWVKIEALKTTVPEQYAVYPEFLWNANSPAVIAAGTISSGYQISWQEGVLYGGMLLAALYFGYKLYRLRQLREQGTIEHFPNFTQVVVKNSELAFSFFKSIFLGDKVLSREHKSIIQHELVHIKQKHSLDLVFFELMRIIGWFNPLVYVYQNRISELHELIADAHVPKTERAAHYDLLLSQVFQTQNISFVNQFYKKSLIKKRIVMLQKSKSKKIFQLKYLLLVPLVFGMLAYTSLETTESNDGLILQTPEDKALIAKINKEIENEIAKVGSLEKVFFKWKDKYNDLGAKEGILSKEIYFKREIISERLMDKRIDSLKNAKTSFFYGSNSIKKRIPTTVKYESYVQHMKVFELLDKNLQYSIENRFQNGGTSIKFLDVNTNFSSDLLVFEVKDVKDLTGDEVRTFNTRISEIFETKTSKFKGLVVTDGAYSFEVFDLDLEESVAIENPVNNSLTVISFSEVENVPIFPGCADDADKRGCFFESMREHIRKNFNYPQEAQEKGIQGRVNTMFTIDETGMITDLKMRGPDSLLINEASRIIGKLPKMIPGNHKGKTVGVAFSIPITFKLKSESSNESEEVKYDNATQVPFSVVDEIPIFPGCEDVEDKRVCFNKKMMAHISNNFQYPQEAQDKGIQGRVNIMFTIGKDGVVNGLRMRGPDKLLEGEAKRIVDLLPTMKPGRQKGKEVDVPYSIPISFRLGDDATVSNSGVKVTENGIRITSKTNERPIYFLDGVETTMEYVKTINPDDIESVNILKDKAAEDKYGAKGKNGVIEITLKQKE